MLPGMSAGKMQLAAGGRVVDIWVVAWRAATLVFAATAAALAIYLAALALLNGRLPPGCGEGSGCGDVLTSTWSRLFGIPVSLPAVGMYGAVAILALLSLWLPIARRLLVLCSACILGAVAWFVVLQAFVLHAFCVYCMIDHSFGALAAVAALVGCVREEGRMPWHYAVAGLVLTGLMVTAQALQPHTPYRLELPTGNDFDFRRHDGRYVGLQDGVFQLRIEDEPMIGDPEAERSLVLMVDYACLHCRRLHRIAGELQDQHPDRLVVTVLPTPISTGCNTNITNTPEGFEESCELAQCSLAVFFAAPELWVDFDEWMFDGERIRKKEAAFERARTLIGQTALERGMAGEEVKEMIARNVSAWGAIPVQHEGERRVPVAWTPGQSPIVGPVDEASALEAFLEGPPPGAPADE